MSTASGGGLGVPPTWREYRSAHFVFSFVSDPHVKNNVTALATRLEAVRDATVEALGLEDQLRERVQVYLLSYMPDERHSEGRRDDSQVYEAGGRQVISVRLSDAPGEALERGLMEMLFTSSLSVRADGSAMLIDGMLGYVAQQTGAADPARLHEALARLQSEGRRISLERAF